MRNSIRGWVYLEATMNQLLHSLLKRTPGIILHQSGLIVQAIQFKDWVPLLETHDSQNKMDVGKWVEVRKGMYKGDVGFVDSVESWGVYVLLVPRLTSPSPSYILPSKRKRTTPHATPALFDPVLIQRDYGIEPKRIQENVFSFKGYDFEHGLIVKSYAFDSISTVRRISLSSFCLFRDSRHPKLTASGCSFPRPLEWDFAVGDDVQVVSSTKQGTITSVLTDTVEVDLDTKEGIVSVPWIDILKVMQPGDYVEITGGPCRGQTGWFEGMQTDISRYDVACILQLLDINKPLLERTKVFPLYMKILLF
jgi:hypothetical protein